MSLRDPVVDELEAADHDVPPWLQTVPDDVPEEIRADEYRRRWDGFTATGEEGR